MENKDIDGLIHKPHVKQGYHARMEGGPKEVFFSQHIVQDGTPNKDFIVMTVEGGDMRAYVPLDDFTGLSAYIDSDPSATERTAPGRGNYSPSK